MGNIGEIEGNLAVGIQLKIPRALLCLGQIAEDDGRTRRMHARLAQGLFVPLFRSFSFFT